MSTRIPMLRTAAAAALLVLACAGGAAAQQSKDQQKCLNTVNKDGTLVAKAQGKANVACVKDAGLGKLVGTAESCLTADPKGKLQKAKDKTVADAAKSCGTAPGFGYPGTAATNAGAEQAELDLIEDVFGEPLDAAITSCAANKAGCQCQQKVVAGVQKIADTKLAEFLKCKKAVLKNGANAAAALDDCVDDAATPGSIAADTKARVAKAVAKLGTDIAKKCDALGVTTTSFPGTCTGRSGNALAQCLDRLAECRVCQAINAMDALLVNCDLFDDGAANGTCDSGTGTGPTPTPGPTATPGPTSTTTLPCEGDPDFPGSGAGWPACGGSCPDPNYVCQAYTYELTLGRTTRGCACVHTGSVCGPSDLPPTPGCSAACTLGFSLAPTIGACPSGSACTADEGLSVCTNLYDPSDGTCTPLPDYGNFFKKYRCRVPETACGNGIVEAPFGTAPEQCDDGNAVEGDGCSTTCQFNFCGNGTVEPGEQCDDGNVTSGDGCSFLCQLNEFEGCNVTGTWSGEIFGFHDWTFIEAPNGAVTGVSWYRANPASVSPVTGSRSGSGLQLVALGGVSLTGTLTTCDAMTLLSDFFPIEITRVRNDYCGDGVLAPAYEACDDGNLAPGDGCSPSCVTNG